MRRVRLLIYDGPEDWIKVTKAYEYYKEGKHQVGSNHVILSIDLHPDELTLFECKIKEVSDGQ